MALSITSHPIRPTRARRRTGLRVSGAVRPFANRDEARYCHHSVAKSFPRVSAISAGEVALDRRNLFIQSELILYAAAKYIH
jgi:hypothetical protein